MKITRDDQGDVAVLRLSGRMTLGGGEMVLRRTFDEMLDAGERRFLLDLRKIAFMDSAAIGETCSCAKRAADRHGSVKVLLAERSRPAELFMVTQLDQAFPTFHDEAEALRSFA